MVRRGGKKEEDIYPRRWLSYYYYLLDQGGSVTIVRNGLLLLIKLKLTIKYKIHNGCRCLKEVSMHLSRWDKSIKIRINVKCLGKK